MQSKNLKECLSGKENINKNSHQAQTNEGCILNQFSNIFTRKVFLWIFNKRTKALLTLEAALILPVFILSICTLVSILDGYRIQSLVKKSLRQSALELGMYAYAGENAINSAVCSLYAQKQLPEFEDNIKISTLGSRYYDNKITLVAKISYSMPIRILPFPPLEFFNVSEVYGWVGASRGTDSLLEKTNSQMVYVTDYESVYHTNSNCTHLDLTIFQGKKSEVQASRNEYGSKYRSCDKCCDMDSEQNQTVYYTSKGDCYHFSQSCSGLKRNVQLIELSEVFYLNVCERCGK